jgi:hypothetical protein
MINPNAGAGRTSGIPRGMGQRQVGCTDDGRSRRDFRPPLTRPADFSLLVQTFRCSHVSTRPTISLLFEFAIGKWLLPRMPMAAESVMCA